MTIVNYDTPPEVPPNLGAAKVCKANVKSIKICIFFGFAEVPPNLGMLKSYKKGCVKNR